MTTAYLPQDRSQQRERIVRALGPEGSRKERDRVIATAPERTMLLRAPKVKKRRWGR